MTSSITLFVALLLGSVGYEQVTVIGRPDTVKLLLSPQRVVEHRDTVIVLDEERPGSLLLKRFGTDGEFIDEREYDPSDNSILFGDQGFRPDSASLAPLMRRVDAGAFTLIRAVRTGDTLWAIYGVFTGGDADGCDIAAIDTRADSVITHGWGPVVSSVYRVSSLRERLTRIPRWPSAVPMALAFCVGRNHLYLVAAGFLWQYDKQVHLVRRVGQANGCFLEPSGLALTPDGTVLISDFRLGNVWRYDAHTGRLALWADSGVTGSSSVPYLTANAADDAWLTNAEWATLLHIRAGRTDELKLRGFPLIEGGSVYRIAHAGQRLVLWDPGVDDEWYRAALIYDTTGRPLHLFEGDHNDPRYAGICGLDNTGNVVLFRTTDMRRFCFWRISADARDTTPLVVSDSSVHMTPWMFRLCSRLGDTLYVLGAQGLGRSRTLAHALYTFVQDTLVDVVPPSSFSGGLNGYYTDFGADRHGNLWIVDIGERVVRQYRPVRR